MTKPHENFKDNKDLIFLAMLLAIALVVFELWMAMTNHDNSRVQHLGGAVAYAKGHIDLLRPMILGFNANGAPTPLEFPIWQALTALLMKCFGLWYGWGNVISLIFLFASLWALFDLCQQLASFRIGCWAIIFSLVQPLSFVVGGQAGGDSAAWAFAMFFIYFSYRMMIELKWSWWFLAVCAGSLSATTKAPFFMTAGLTLFFWLLLKYRNSGLAWFFLISSGVISMIFFAAWNLHCHMVYAEAKFPMLNLNTFGQNATLNQWYFGTMSYRLNIYNWVRGGWHLTCSIFGGFGFIFLFLISIRLKKAQMAWLWIFAAVCTTCVFTPLLWEHDHYFFIYAPATAWLCALTVGEFEFEIWKRLHLSVLTRTIILLLTLIVSLAGTLMAMHFNILFDPYAEKVAQSIKQHTSPEEKIIVWGMSWGDPFLRADRQGLTGGLSLANDDWISDPEKLRWLKEAGYKKIVLLNPPPFIVALTSVTGKHGEKIEDLHQRLPSVAKNWPIIFDTTQVLIIQIPD